MMMRMRSIIIIALACALEGCVVLPVLGGPPPRDDFLLPYEPLEPGLRDVRGMVHCHSKLSHDCSGELESIAAAAVEDQVAFVILTDHLREPTDDDGPDGPIGGVLFIPGFETRSVGGGSLLSLGARARIDPRGSDEDVIARIRARGALVAIAHPEEVQVAGIDEPDAVELMNLHADVLDENYFTLALRFLFFPPRAFFRSIVDRQARGAVVYDSFARARPLAAIGACDAHEAIRPLGPLAGAVDSYRRVFLAASTHVLVRDVTKEAVLDALRAGRSYAACELVQDATGFQFRARRAIKTVAIIGGETPLASDLDLLVEAPVPCRIAILRDGAPLVVSEKDVQYLIAPVRRPGAYRVEATLGGKPWVATSAIRVTADVAPVGSATTIPRKR